MSRSTASQYGRIYAALKALGIDEDGKKDMVVAYTCDPAKTSLKDLTFEQCSDMVMKLNHMISPSAAPAGMNIRKAPTLKGVYADESAADREISQKIRRKIIAIAHNLGWYRKHDDGSLDLKDFKKQLDYAHLDMWLIKHTAAKKRLNEMNKSELQKAAYQIDSMYKATITKPSK